MNNLGKMNIEEITARMSLRVPQTKSLEVLDDILTTHDIAKGELKELEKAIAKKYDKFREFERGFPSMTFALATGVGKTRLMGAMMLYLHQNFGIKNFFIVAPNLPIYEKLKKDFGDPSHPKYVFKGLQQYAQNWPRLITGENYETKGNAMSLFDKSITINVFNIAKFNRGDGLARIHRAGDYVGEDGYFKYLSKLPDLVMMMDESHHYRADAGFKALNELDPLLGLEFTATPQVETSKGAIPFKNVVYEYSLAKAIGNYVKTPWVATKKNFNAKSADDAAVDRIKLIDGLTIHRNTQAELRAYAENEGKKVIKPFVLVVCKNTTHAAEIMDFIKSAEFFEGYYKDKVIEIHSAQKGAERDSNIDSLLRLESEDNKIEIVVHVNMLKEGWDVTNLYTIIPLRVAASMTLREQTIGRGLRLPYGKITGNEAVDRLTIVAHDLFNDIVRAASDENSLIRKQHIIDIDDLAGSDVEATKPKTVFAEKIELLGKKEHFARSDKKKEELAEEKKTYEIVGRAIQKVISRPVNIAISQLDITGGSVTKTATIVPTTKNLHIPEVKELVVKEAMRIAEEGSKDGTTGFLPMDFIQKEKRAIIEKKIAEAVDPAIEIKQQHTIDIPSISIVAKGTGGYELVDFDLYPYSMRWYSSPADEIVLQDLKHGKSKEIQSTDSYDLPDGHTPITYIINAVLDANNLVTYEDHGELLAKLAGQLVAYLNKEYPPHKVNGVLMSNVKEMAKEISEEIDRNAKVLPPEFEAVLLQASSEIQLETQVYVQEKNFKELVPYYALKKTRFYGFEKSCVSKVKFDSEPEQIFSIILEKDDKVEKWLRPAIGQLDIKYGQGERYKPDFIVETTNIIWIIEVKPASQIKDAVNQLKKAAAIAYCDHANTFNRKLNPTAKPWRYAFVEAEKVARNMGFDALVRG